MIVIGGLALHDRKALAEFLTLYLGTATVVIVLAVLVPAVGAYVHHSPDAGLLERLSDPAAGRWHLADFTALRDGAFSHLSFQSMEGIITFPSLHTALAILFARAFWRLPYLGFVGLALNGMMIVSTLAVGGHYLVDTLAGGVIALLGFAALRARHPPAGSLRMT